MDLPHYPKALTPLAVPLLVEALSLLTGTPGDALSAVLLAIGGLGLGTGFATLIAHLTEAIASRHAPDISDVSTTLQIGEAIDVTAFGSIYLTLASHPGTRPRGQCPARHRSRLARHGIAPVNSWGVLL